MRPTKAQALGLRRAAGARRWVWNWALARVNAYYKAHREHLSLVQLSSELTLLKKVPGTTWLRDAADAQALQQALLDLYRSFSSFFAGRAGWPRFKTRKRDLPRFRVPQRVKLQDGKVYVPKIGWIRLRQSREVVGRLKSVTFKGDTDQKWYAVFLVEFDLEDCLDVPADPAKVVGVDLGVRTFATFSNETRILAPTFYREAERKLNRAQRCLSRRVVGSKGHARARQRVLDLSRKVRNRRSDFLHKLSTRLVREHDGLCIEDLAVSGMARAKSFRGLPKSVLDASFGEFRRQLEYKTVWNRKQLAVVDRFFPSSRLCSVCGEIHKDLKLSDRYWVCCKCGAEHDRDLNAAKNILAEGLKQMNVAVGRTETQNAGGLDTAFASAETRSKPEFHSRGCGNVNSGLIPVAVSKNGEEAACPDL